MENKDYITVGAILATLIASGIGAFLGFIYQKISENKRDKKNILAILMAYRGIKAYEDDFVKALNMIDVYFYDSSSVRKLCHQYFDSLDVPIFATGQHERILRALILAMAKDCGYSGIVESDIAHYYLPEAYIQRYGGKPDKTEP
ncbi:DUF6680 family protein [Pedobacter sp. JCM 36344]|uniref:DUF6680 family protein n=1 Tax=Pedobacter sp. JCM 36344 TaxID=3374280 RepID=UPI00397C1173